MYKDILLYMCRRMCTGMLTCLLHLSDSEKEKQSTYPSKGESILSIWYSHRIEYYAEVRRKGLDQYVSMESSQEYVEWGKKQVLG